MAMKERGGRATRASTGAKKAGASRRVSARGTTFDLDEAVAAETAPSTTSRFTATFASAALTRGVGGRVRDQDVNDFLRQLIMLLEAGTPLLRSLTILTHRGERAGIRNLVADITQHVESGNALWQAFERWPRNFDPVFVNLIKASEASGTLNTVLKRLVIYRERKAMLARRIKGAMWYPTILVLTCVGVLFLIAKVVVPEFRDLFDRLDIDPAKIPWYTTWVMNTAVKITSLPAIIIALAIIIGVPIAYVFAVRVPGIRYAVDHIKLRLPRIGKAITKKSAVVDMCRSMALLLRSGLSMLVTLDLVRANVRNTAVQAVVAQIRDSVERGEGIEEPLRRASGIIPPVVTDMLVTGEDSGQLDAVAEHIADTYDEEVSITINTIGELIQPILTVFLGVVVLVLFVSLFMPLLATINQLISDTGGAGSE